MNEPYNHQISRRLAWLLDQSIRLPGGYKIGLDGLLGLIPGIGDGIGLMLSAWIIWDAIHHAAPASVLCRMIFNILIDALLGAIPLVGDLFDFAWKANERNLNLLERQALSPGDVKKETSRFLIGVVLLLLLVILVAFGIFWSGVQLIYSLF